MPVHTLRGQVVAGRTQRLLADDGKFTHGHRITSFHIIGANNGALAAEAVLHYSDSAPANINFEQSDQFGWALWDADTTTGNRHFSIIDPDHVVNADLHVTALSGSANFIITVEPITMSEAQGVLQLIKSKRQG